MEQKELEDKLRSAISARICTECSLHDLEVLTGMVTQLRPDSFLAPYVGIAGDSLKAIPST